MAWYSLLALILLAVLPICIFVKKKNNTKKRKLPPGPRPLPILGHFHLLGESPHIDLLKLAKKYGPIMFLKFGFIPNIVISSPEAAEQVLKIHDTVFASRPPHEAAKYASYEQRGLSFAPYGSYWRSMRKMCTLELLSSNKIATFRSMRKEEVNLLIAFIRETARDQVAVNLSKKISTMSADMSCRMVFGKKYDDKEFSEKGFIAVIQEGMRLAASPNLGDYYPYLGALDLQGLTRKLKAVSKVFDSLFEKIIDDHVHCDNNTQGKTKDFVDILLAFMVAEDAELQIDKRHVKAIMLDMLAGSMDTSSTATEWMLSDLFKHPKVLKKVQNELEKVVGLDRMVEEQDLEKLTYFDMVVKESFRLHPVAPLLIPHLSTQDCNINGYFIPKNARVIINAYAIARDPNVWPDADKFLPDRFLGQNVDIRGNDFRLIPFGAGRRGCPGLQLGLTVVKLVVAQLVHCFEWELPDNILPDDLDMTEEFGLVTSRAKNLLAIPTYRLLK